ncbi:NAD(P)/FAD-dependent oxidoreductase [Kineococcus sp. SYSU DK003]|uniref:NAD(P)/FAD-dependent oxidoreductase n=1 Tax=Kineococcus sp. SYSU DK003 TaxID=3383124 RepID=UPI003D7E94FF
MRPQQRQQVVVAGAGVAGATAALALGDQGHDVVVVERDEGRPPERSADVDAWRRRGVPHFHQPHAFQARMFAELDAGLPDVARRLDEAGAVPVPLGPTARSAWLRRSLLERVLHGALADHPAIRTVSAGVRGLDAAGGRVRAVRLTDGGSLPADLVVDATGRRGRLGVDVGGSPEVWDEPCDEVYTSRRYRLHPGAEPGTVNRAVVSVSEGDGYTLLVFPHDHGYFTITFTRLPEDDGLARLREEPLFERAVAAVPLAAQWADPARSAPVSEVLVMAGLRNRFSRGTTGVPLGVHAVGDSVCTTNPHFGRGSSLAVASALRLATAVADSPGDPQSWRAQHDAWRDGELRGWFDDTCTLDRERSAVWRAALHHAPVPASPAGTVTRSDVLAAAGRDPVIGRAVGQHMNLLSAPESIEALVPRVLRLRTAPPVGAPAGPPTGHRPPVVPPAPPRDALLEAVLASPLAVTG